MKTAKIAGVLRGETGKKDATALRNAGRVPCELYGPDLNVHFSLDEIALTKLLHTPDAFEFHIDVEGTEYRAVMKETQFHPITDRPLHIDFLAVQDDREVTVKLPVKLIGNAEGVRAGGKLNVLLRKLAVRGLPGNLPDSIDLNIAPLKIGDSIRVRDLSLNGVQALAADSAVVVAVKTSRKAMAAAAGADDDDDEEGGEAEGEGEAEG